MKLSCLLPALSAVLLFCACHHSPNQADADRAKAVDTAARKNYFPVLNFLKSEIAYVDSFPLKIMEYRIRNGKTDSNIINTKTFDRLASAFLIDGLDSSRFEKRFDETSFLDQSNNLLTFTYSTKDTSYGLRRVDVLAVPDRGVDKVKSIYLESSSGNADSLILNKMFWRTRKSFSIIHIYQPRQGVTGTSQTKVVWDNSE
jgi:hypothetical protein